LLEKMHYRLYSSCCSTDFKGHPSSHLICKYHSCLSVGFWSR